MGQAFDEMGCLKQSFESHDVKMVFGDLNFWIDCTYQEGIEKSDWFEHEDMQFLQQRDQLLPIIEEGKEFPDL